MHLLGPNYPNDYPIHTTCTYIIRSFCIIFCLNLFILSNYLFVLMIAEKCVNITGYDSNFYMEDGFDFISISANSSYYRYTGENETKGMDSTTASLIGIKSEKLMTISFFR